tara:strand:- start:398 stop:598 length:201 start_codon:yes stop_codon:yes gene_type:complete
METKFKDGDVVYLKSGSPAMTIAYYDETVQMYHCKWFVSSELKYYDFREHELTKDNPNDSMQIVMG